MNERKNILINYRIEQASQVIKDAMLLLNEGGSPRSIINRAYYAMFYAVLALLVKIGKGTSKHSGAIAIFDVDFVKQGIFAKEMSQLLHKAFNLRQNSDYKELGEITIEDAKELFQEAGEFVDRVKNYFEIKKQLKDKSND